MADKAHPFDGGIEEDIGAEPVDVHCREQIIHVGEEQL